MPKLDAKQVQAELEKGLIWPVYWIYGPERLKARELFRRIQIQMLGIEEANHPQSMSRIRLDGATSTIQDVLQEATAMSLFGGRRVIVVDQAHLLKEVESIQEILGERRSLDETSSCVVFLSKDLDGRKKSSKILTESAAVIACDEVTEEEREPWIHYLAKRADLIWAKDAELAPVWRQLVDRLRLLEPWSLEMIDSEIAKLSLCEPGSAVNPQDLLSGQTSQDTQAFIEAFLKKDRTRALSALASFADRPEEVFPLLGLLAWNVRHLAVLLKDRESRTRSIKLSPFLAERLEKTADRWKLKEALLIQERLLDMDFSFKQTQRMPLGVWSDFVITCLA